MPRPRHHEPWRPLTEVPEVPFNPRLDSERLTSVDLTTTFRVGQMTVHIRALPIQNTDRLATELRWVPGLPERLSLADIRAFDAGKARAEAVLGARLHLMRVASVASSS